MEFVDVKMKIIKISDDAYDWFMKERKKHFTSETECMLRLLNWWELLPTKPKIWRGLDSSAYEFIVKERE